MKLTRLGDLASATEVEVGTQNEIEAEIRDLVQRDSMFAKPRRPAAVSADEAHGFVGRISAEAIAAIDSALDQLQRMKAALLDEQEKLRLHIRAFELSSQEASASLKDISETLAQWRGSTLDAGSETDQQVPSI
jgi:hypothetical protein